VAVVQSYLERVPVAALSDLVRVVWIQQIGTEPYVQRNLPTGGVELQCPIGSPPRLVGPLTGPSVEVLAPGTTVIGARFRPGAGAALLGLPASELVDLTVPLDDVAGPAAMVLGERLCLAGAPETALSVAQDFLVDLRVGAPEPDPVVSEAVRRLMPWPGGEVGTLCSVLALSPSQLRRRCLTAVGVGPKTLQRTLRFQGFLALAQAGGILARPPRRGRPDEPRLRGRPDEPRRRGRPDEPRRRGRPDEQGGGLAGLAAEAGYADQAHLSRECVRLTGLPPRSFLGDREDSCGCGHDHSASFVPFLRGHPGLNTLISFKPAGSRPA
jgi:AraC-like DNA-binding protein